MVTPCCLSVIGSPIQAKPIRALHPVRCFSNEGMFEVKMCEQGFATLPRTVLFVCLPPTIHEQETPPRKPVSGRPCLGEVPWAPFKSVGVKETWRSAEGRDVREKHAFPRLLPPPAASFIAACSPVEEPTKGQDAGKFRLPEGNQTQQLLKGSPVRPTCWPCWPVLCPRLGVSGRGSFAGEDPITWCSEMPPQRSPPVQPEIPEHSQGLGFASGSPPT